MTRLPEDFEGRLRAAAGSGVEFTAQTDAHGVTVAWAGLAKVDELLPVALLMRQLGARLSMITASQPPAPEAEEDADDAADDAAKAAEPAPPPKTFGDTPLDGTSYEIAYHFDLGGDTVTVVVFVAAGGSLPSLTALFRTADWGERELMELYNIVVREHPDPRRLFLDASIDPAVFERLIPFSTLVNAASTKGLWEKIMTAKSGGGA